MASVVMWAAVPLHPECSSATIPEGWAMNTGTQSATPTASAIPFSEAMCPSASSPRSQPSQPPVCTRTRVPWTCRIDASRRAVSASSCCTAVHRPMTSLTGSVPERPNDPASRVVVKARIPQLSKSGIASFGTSFTLLAAIVDASNRGTERVQALIDALVAALDLADVVDEARTFGAQCREQHCHSRADVRRLEERAAQARRPVYQRAVRIAEHDARAHGGPLVDAEHARLEHLLVHENESLALRRGDDRDGHRVRGERRPRLVFELRHMAAHVGLDLPRLLRRHDQVRPILYALDPQAGEPHPRRAKMLDAGVFDSQLRLGYRGEPNKGADLDVIGTDGVCNRLGSERPAAMNGHRVGADALDLRSQRAEKMRQVLDVGLARGVAKNGGAGRCRRRHQRVLGCGDTRLVEKHVGAAEAVDAHLDHLAVRELGAELLESEEVGVEPSASDHVAAGWWQRHVSAAREKGRGEKDRRSDLGAQHRIEIGRTQFLGEDIERVPPNPFHGGADRANELDERLDVTDPRNVLQMYFVLRKKRRGHNRQRGVLVSGRPNRATEGSASLDDELQCRHVDYGRW